MSAVSDVDRENRVLRSRDSFRLLARIVKDGHAEGIALVSREPIGFLGSVDPDTGVVIKPGHSLAGQSVAGAVLVFPTGKGSTVGSYTLFQLAHNGVAPVGIINVEADPVIAVGAIISDIAMVDHVDISLIQTGDAIVINDAWVDVRPR